MGMRRVSLAGDDTDGMPAIAAPAPVPVRARSQVWKGFAAFLLGMTLGVTAIVLGQAAFTGHARGGSDVPFEGPVELRRS